MGRDDEGAAPDVQMMAELAALDAAGRRAVDAGDYAAARTAFERELALRREQGDKPGTVYALFHVAWVLRFGQGEIAAARPLLEEALAITREVGSPLHIGAALGDPGSEMRISNTIEREA